MAEPPVREADPVRRAERLARLRSVAPLAAGATWVELRAASGPAAPDPSPEGATTIVDDLTDPVVLGRVRAAAGQGALVTAFDALEHQPSFGPLLETLLELAREHGATVVLAVPNDAFGPLRAAGESTWGDGAFAELRSLLPDDHVVWHQLALRGSALVPDGYDNTATTTVPLRAEGTPVAFLAAFGPRARELAPVVDVSQADLAAERAARRALESELAVLRARVGAGEVS